MRDLERSSPDCALCRLFVQSLADANLKSGEPVILIRDNKSHVVRLPGQDMPVISLYSEPGKLWQSPEVSYLSKVTDSLSRLCEQELISSSTWASAAHKNG
jgi:hypothetical protein